MLCCARLRVSQANRAVIVFAMFRFVFLPTPSAVVVVFAIFRTSIRSHHHDLYKTQARAVIPSLITFVPHFIHSFIPALALPAKKTTLHSKNIRQPCVFNVGCQSPLYKSLIRSSFRFFPFWLSLPATFVPLAIGSRLSLRQAGKALHFVSLLSHLPSFGSGLLYLLGFPLRPRTAPDHPPLKKEEAQLYYSPIRLIFLFRS